MNTDQDRYARIVKTDDAKQSPVSAQTRAWMRATYFFWAFSFTIHAALLAVIIPAKFAARPALAPFAADFEPVDPSPIESQTLNSIDPSNDEPPDCCGPVDPEPPQPPTPPVERPVPRPDPEPVGERPFTPPYPPHTYVKSNARSILMALDWIARHQSRDGSWNLQRYNKQCADKSCTGVAEVESQSAATGFAMLTMLAAAQTGLNGKYKQQVFTGLYWLLSHQRSDGDLSAGARQQMYSHAIATIALCEEFDMTQEKPVGVAAQKAIKFIETAQDKHSGGWQYYPRDSGDTSVFGWQMMALESAKLAGLQVDSATLVAAGKWLASLESSGGDGKLGGRYLSCIGTAPSPAMSSVGLLCNQWLGADRRDPRIVGGVQFMFANPPDANGRDVTRWFFASQALHNMDDRDWDVWRRNIRRLLATSQTREGCAAGSWDPEWPKPDAWWGGGGRLMVTSLSCLTLELDYGYLPLFRRCFLPSLQRSE